MKSTYSERVGKETPQQLQKATLHCIPCCHHFTHLRTALCSRILNTCPMFERYCRAAGSGAVVSTNPKPRAYTSKLQEDAFRATYRCEAKWK